jgi:hypothetical protein
MFRRSPTQMTSLRKCLARKSTMNLSGVGKRDGILQEDLVITSD